MELKVKLPIGKLSHNLLKEIIYKRLGNIRPDVVLGPGIGLDSAIVESGDKYIYVTTDPITASKELIGTLCVYVTTNDLVATGALPKWLLIDALLNKGITTEELRKIFDDVNEACKFIDIGVVGGHTEVTPYLDRPILIGTAIGTSNKMLSREPESGDIIIMTKSVGIEGAVIISYEFTQLLEDSGVSDSVINRNRELLNMVTVVPEAKVLFESIYDEIVALHDPTEGGIYTALNELLESLKCGAVIYEDNIIVSPDVREVTDALRLNPYHLLSSGCLVALIKKDFAEYALKELRAHGIDSAIIGEIKDIEFGRKVVRGNKVTDLPVKVEDEIWKLF